MAKNLTPLSTPEWRNLMRECNRCHQPLPMSEFHSHSAMCKQCKAMSDKGRIRSNSRNVNRNNTEAARARKRKWLKVHYDPAKFAARRAVRSAIEASKLIPLEHCEKCGNPRKRRDGARAIHAHHYRGYSYPLDVQWLCPVCHTAAHNAASKGEKP